jgi:hypothetical protein
VDRSAWPLGAVEKRNIEILSAQVGGEGVPLRFHPAK